MKASTPSPDPLHRGPFELPVPRSQVAGVAVGAEGFENSSHTYCSVTNHQGLQSKVLSPTVEHKP